MSTKISGLASITAITPLLLVISYGIVYVLGYPYHCLVAVVVLVVLGLKYNRYTFTASIVLNGAITVFDPHLGVLCLASWLLGVSASSKTAITDMVLSLTIGIVCVDYVLGLEYMEIVASTPLIVLFASRIGVSLDKAIGATSIALILLSIAITLAKTTSTYLVLDIIAATSITIILVVERIVKSPK